MTSHDVVGLVRRRLRIKRVGHAGTLDPAAEGILVVAVGRATKLIDRVQSQEKQYLAHLVLGASTDTLDAEGRLVAQKPCPFPTSEAVATVLQAFTGRIEQVPPAHSAIKLGGEALYHRARRGEAVEIPSRSVVIHGIQLLRADGADIVLLIDCSKGTYIRSLARDIGEALGFPAYLHYLLRTRTGRFDLAQAWSIEEIEQQLSLATFAAMALHPDCALPETGRVILDSRTVPSWYHGQPVRASNEPPNNSDIDAQGSVYRFDGEWLGVAQRIGTETWQPRTVMQSERPNSEQMASKKKLDDTEESVARHVVTVGSFDGVHRGHQYLLQRVIDRAHERGARSAAVTFDPLPLEFLRPELAPQRITSTSDRLRLLSACGIDDVTLLTFDAELSSLAPDAFIDRLHERLRPELIVVGADFAFGHKRAGTLDVLRELGAKRGFEVEVHERIGDETSDFSSTRVRQALSVGDVAHAADLLGRPFSLSGIVVDGNHRGRTLGFPTANLKIPPRQVIPAEGIYAAKVGLDGEPQLLPSMVYIGSRPTFGDGGQTVEVNILDFSRDIYGHQLTLLFAARIRADQTFDSIEALIRQMRHDQDETVNALDHLSSEWPGPLGEAVAGIGEGVRSREH